MGEQLKRCPFCGGKAERALSWGSNEPVRLFHCANEKCIAHQYEQDEQGGYSVEFGSDAEAIAAWNRRDGGGDG